MDLCGDGLCSGYEAYNVGCSYNSSSFPYYPRSSCTTVNCAPDCTLYHNQESVAGDAAGVTRAGSTITCIHRETYSRAFMAKRALRTVLPELRKSANFGLTTFEQSGYYRYYPASATAATDKVTIFLTEWELRNLGMWSSGPVATCDPSGGSCGWRGGGWSGAVLTRLDGAGLTVTKDSLYHRSDDATIENRFEWSTANSSYDSGGHTWNYVGSYYTYTQQGIQDVALGSTNVVTPYRGPQFTESGTTWVYYRRYPGAYAGTTQQDIDGSTMDGREREAITTPANQAEADAKVGRMLSHLNLVTNGGLLFGGSTPTGEAMQRVRQAFDTRHTADTLRKCRKRYALVITDGDSRGDDPIPEAEQLFCEYCNNKSDCNSSGANTTNCDDTHDDNNPIKTIVVALPGLNTDGVTEVNGIADAGDPLNSSAAPYMADNETELIDAIRTALTAAVNSDYTTAAAGMTSESGSAGGGTWAVVPSVEYPDWKGHLRAWDLTKNPVEEKWDAADALNSRPWNNRELFSGYPTYNSGNPVALYNRSTGVVDVSTIRTLWEDHAKSTFVTTLSDTNISNFIKWLAGDGRAHKLPPIMRCVPATIGPPLANTLKDHASWASGVSTRESLVYITSNEGLIHAFRGGDTTNGGGTEVFAYIPPTLFDVAYKLFEDGGQDATPTNFKWIMANSPRVSDVYDSTNGWSTQLVVPFGPNQHGLVVLDITNPTDCSSQPCSLNTNPFKVVAAVRQEGASEKMETASNQSDVTYGEGWSIPAMYWTVASGEAACHGSMASGYGAATTSNYYVPETKGHYYSYMGDMWLPPTTQVHSPPGVPKVDYAVLANSAAVVDRTANDAVIAAYQADLAGRITRYDQGNTTTISTILDVDEPNPFYYGPAVMQLDDTKKVVLAANSGSADEASPPSPDIETHLYMRSELLGTLDTDYTFTCAVSALATCLNNPSSLGAGDLPTSAAKPVGTPLLLHNDPGSGTRVEVFFLLYEPSAASCSGAFGTSYLVRVSVDAAGTTYTLESADKVSGRASGMTLAGGGTRVVLTKSGEGTGSKSQPDHLGKPVAEGSFGATPPNIESWREVR